MISPRCRTLFLKIFAVILMICLIKTTAIGQEKIDSLANKLPPGANVIMMIDVAGIQQSAMAAKDEWATSVKDRYSSGMGKVLRNSSVVVVGANVNQRWEEPVWRAALLAERGTSSYPAMQQSFNGTVDRQLGFDFMEMTNDSFVFSPLDGVIGVFAPNERQFFSRWLKHLNQPTGWLNGSNLIQSVEKFNAAESHVVIGADLRYSYSPVRILEQIQDSELLKGQGIDAKQFAKLASTVDGFTIATKFTDKIETVVELTFSEDISPLKLAARDLTFDFLDDAGINIPEMVNWQVNVNGQKITVTGPLSIEGFRLMVSELDLIDDMPTWAIGERDESDPSMTTRQYFASVNRLMDDLRNRKSASVNFGSNAGWMERYARRIQRLPTQYVDQEVVDFADQAILMLIEASTDLRNTAEKNKTDSAAIRERRSNNRGGSVSGTRSSSRSRSDYGALSLSVHRDRRFSRFHYSTGGSGDTYQQQHASRKNAEKVWTDINLKLEDFAKASLKLQRQLEQKYNIEF